MSLFSKLFRKKSFGPKTESNRIPTQEQLLLESFKKQIDSLLSQDVFIAQSDIRQYITEYKELYSQFKSLHNTGTLSYFCHDRNLAIEDVEQFISFYEDFQNAEESLIIKKHNDDFVNRHLKKDKTYLDTILKNVDAKINLDDEQRRVVLSDEDYTLVIAGAGAGKTTTVAAKVKYLVEQKNIHPEQILVISFTNKAVDELRDKINSALKINCPITTFHKTGYAILRRQDNDRKTIVDQGFMFNVINNYLKGNILDNPALVDKLILFFGSYFDAPFEGKDLNDFFNYIKKADFSTLRGNMGEFAEKIIDKRTGKNISIAYETLRSSEEVRIANFLYMHGIEYSYEKIYPYNIPQSHKPYTPDFTIIQDGRIAYIEHFGITQNGCNLRYTAEQLDHYKEMVKDKVTLHRQHGTDLIYTFSEYNDGRDLLIHLREELTNRGFELHPRPAREIYDKIIGTEENRYISKLVKLICTFIHNFKTNGYTLDDFNRFLVMAQNQRSKLFLSICEQCFMEYTKRLKEKNAIDFEDMINNSARILREEEIKGKKLDFKYIIVDEYQDISRQRFNLTKELSNLCDAKIIAVGDDWQSIYAYAGSDITLFTNFKNTFGYGLELRITNTYRNSQEIIDIAGSFIQKNTSQIRKALISPKTIKDPIIIQSYSEDVDKKDYDGKGGKFYLIGKKVEEIIKEILSENPKSSILLLGRYGFDGFNLTKSSDFIYWEKTGNVTSKTFSNIELEFMTAHRSKGLGYDNVIIINAIDGIYGFPSQVQEDPVLKYVVKSDYSIDYAEERRLFYVALTRTKNRVYIVTPQQRPSAFVRELIKDYPNIIVRGKIDNKLERPTQTKTCPICGYPLQFRYKKAYGLRLWICSNEPEICDFMTNNLNGGTLSILKCDQCRDGYLIVKEGETPFLGCTNYRQDKTGCNRIMTMDYYNNLMRGRGLQK